MGVFEQHYRRWQSLSEGHPVATLLLFLLLFLAATSGLLRMHLDLSFRPLFASGEGIAESTAEFEAVFGQSSGAWLAAIVENHGGSANDDLRAVSRMSDAVRRIANVTEVLSITSVAIPEWQDGRLSLIEPLPAWVLAEDEDEELTVAFDALRDGTRFVDWLISQDGKRFLLAARVNLPLDDLQGRRTVVQAFEDTLNREAGDAQQLYFTGVTVVELAYEKQVLRDQVIAIVLTAVSLVLLLLVAFGSVRPVIVCLVPVSLAIPATLGVMAWIGQSVTIINTAIPAIVLVVGVADAVHMLTAWLESRGNGDSPPVANRHMIVATGLACFLTTVTTVVGFLSLTTAKLDAVAGFGLSAGIGIVIAWIANQMLVPVMLRQINAGERLPDNRINRIADDFIASSIRFSLTRPRAVATAALLIALGCVALLPSLQVDQKFNEELAPDHPITVAQKVLEADFGGFLGPEVSVRSRDGSSMLAEDAIRRVERFVSAVRKLDATHHVFSVRDLVTARMTPQERSQAIASMRNSPQLAERTREMISDDESRLSILLRLGDIGTTRAGEYHDRVQQAGEEIFGDDYEVAVVGQWWLAQHGMRLLLRDMLTSLFTAMALVLPILWFALRERRLFVAAAAANLLPLLVPLAFMAATGLTLRIGTAVVLAIALGIAVDNTLHIIIRLRGSLADDVAGQIQKAMHGTGRAVLFTTLALMGGFLSMMGNELLAIRDMGQVAAVAFLAAMLADLMLLPAVYVLQKGRGAG